MKKILAIFLALVTIMSVALVACDKNNGGTTGGNSNDDDDDDIFVTQGNNKETSDTDSKGTNNSSGWQEVSVTIYAMGVVNLRSEANRSDDSNVLAKTTIGQSLSATAKDEDWYKVSYNNQEAYISADFVTTNKAEATFVSCTETVLKVKQEIVNQNASTDYDKYCKVNVRTDPVVDSATETKHVLIYSDTANGELKLVGKNETGSWWKVTYKDNTYYIASGSFKWFEGYSSSSGNGGLG